MAIGSLVTSTCCRSTAWCMFILAVSICQLGLHDKGLICSPLQLLWDCPDWTCMWTIKQLPASLNRRPVFGLKLWHPNRFHFSSHYMVPASPSIMLTINILIGDFDLAPGLSCICSGIAPSSVYHRKIPVDQSLNWGFFFFFPADFVFPRNYFSILEV